MRADVGRGEKNMARVNRTTGVFLILGIVALLGTVAGAVMQQQGGNESSSQGQTTVTENSVYASGNVDVESGLAVLIPDVLGGKVKTILVKEKQSVKKGQLLVQLEDQQQRKQLEIAEQALAVKRAALKDAKEAANRQVKEYELKVLEQTRLLEQAQIAHQAARDVFHDAQKYKENKLGIDADSRLQAAERGVLMARKNMEAAEKALEKLKSFDPKPSLAEYEEALKEAELKVKAATELLDAYTIKAPSDGKVLEINYRVGGSAPLPPGHPAASRALMFRPDEDFIVRAEIDQESAFMVKEGMKVTLTFQAAGKDYTWKGEVDRLSDYIQRRRTVTIDPDTFNESQTRECIIRIQPDSDPNKPKILQNMRLRVQIHTS
jgi:multidrug resistance efflux pump